MQKEKSDFSINKPFKHHIHWLAIVVLNMCVRCVIVAGPVFVKLLPSLIKTVYLLLCNY